MGTMTPMKTQKQHKTLSKIEVVGVVLKPESPELKSIYFDIKKTLQDLGVELLIDQKSASMIDEKGVSFEQMCIQSDFLISIGGDGTLISLARRSFSFHKPIFGINAGNLGFLTDVKMADSKPFFQKMLQGRYRIDNRMVFEITLDGTEETLIAFNDVVFSNQKELSMCTLDCYMDGRFVNSYYGDGVIVSTPTGSTAYNLSAGGPVVSPLSEVLIITPICPHSLTQRPLVVPSTFSLQMCSNEKIQIVIDGQDRLLVDENTNVYVRMSNSFAQVIYKEERNYFDVLRKKLHWGKS